MSSKANFLRWLFTTPNYQRTLSQQIITESEPGTVLRDFETLLDFIRPTGIEVSSTYHLLPKKTLPQLNAQLSRPIQLGLQQPQQKSFPHIHGLYLLLRASGLSDVDEAGARPRLVLDEAALASWRGLNSTERYFTLLEAWLLRGDPEVLGEERGGCDRPIQDWAYFFRRIPDRGLAVAGDKEQEDHVRFSPGLHAVALLELFGLISVQHASPEAGKGWRVASVHRTRLGDALLQLLLEPLSASRYRWQRQRPMKVVLGELQPILQPFFPEWRDNLVLPEPGFQDGMDVFKVSLGKIWRQIAIPARMTLDHLGGSILDAYGFDHDHLYRFTYRSRFGWLVHINHRYLQEAPFTDEVRVGDLPLKPGNHMVYLYDFGDRWEFDLTLERVDPAGPRITRPIVLERHGEAPVQYGGWGE
jgi:hypothetical protein